MRPADAIAWLDGHINLETGVGVPAGSDRRRDAPTLARIEALTALLGSPQLEFPAIHLTGTNGKTSTARILTALLVAEGLSVGTYSSPHLESVGERIALDGVPVDEVRLAELLTRIATIEEFIDDRPSYFEVLTAAALDLFAEVAVDVAVVEVGMGGTWDATSVVQAPVAVVTNVGLDHMEYLGPDRASIAREKAGIVEPGATLVLGERDPELIPIFTGRGPARTLLAGRDFSVLSDRLAIGGRVLDIATPLATHHEVFLALHGPHQAVNAATALVAAEAFLGGPVSPEAVEAAFAAVRSPGRLEVVGRRPLVLLDGAHNPDGLRTLRAALDEGFAGGARTYVLGVLSGRDPDEVIAALAPDPTTTTIVCCRPPSPRALDPERLAAAARAAGLPGDSVRVVPEVADAVRVATSGLGEDEQVVVTGSLYVVGAARALLGRT
ncbi:MAG: bifunctional folylpolyglutamate synthase/dihydrofolate synthase [Actinomycetes bacterium]